MQKKVSIIIPVYNAQDSISRCIDSLLDNSDNTIEIIAINDGSSDGSRDILETYAAAYPNTIRLYSQENQGVARTRNRGIAYSSAEYVMFVDNDDYVDPDYIATFVAEIEASSSDIVLGGYRRTDGEKTLFEMRLARTNWAKYMIVAPWAKIYRRSFLLLHGLTFLDNNIGEDVFFNFRCINLTDKICVAQYVGYNWSFNPNSISNTIEKTIGSGVDVMRLLDSCFLQLQESGNLLTEENEFFFIRYIIWYLLFIGRRSNRGKMVAEYRKVFGWLGEKFPEFRRNHNISLFRPEGEPLRTKTAVYGFMILHRLGLVPLLFRLYCIGNI